MHPERPGAALFGHHLAVIISVGPLGHQNLALGVACGKVGVGVGHGGHACIGAGELKIVEVGGEDDVILHHSHRFGEALGAVGGSIGLTDLDAAFHRDDGGGLSGGCGSRVGGGFFGQLHTQCGGNGLPDGLGGHRGTCNAVDGGAVGGHDLLGQLFQCSAADALGLLCTFQLAVGNGAVGIHGQGGGDSTAKAFGRAGLSHTGSGGAAAAAAGGQRDANNEAHGHGSAQFADDLLFHGSFLQRKIGLCSVPRKGHIFSRMFTKDNIFCDVLSRDFSTYFVKNDKLVSICDADGIRSERTVYAVSNS